MQNDKKVCIAFLGNPSFDSRVTNLSNSLRKDGCKVRVIGFDWETEGFESFMGETSIFQLEKKGSSFGFYFEFAFILLTELLREKADVYFAEDVYTLPFVVFISKLTGGKVHYESRELYAFLGGLRHKVRLQKIIQKIEKFFIKRVNWVITTGMMDSVFLQEHYRIKNTVVLRNIPVFQKPENVIDLREELSIPDDSLIMLYQGVILDGRGIPAVIRVMNKLPNAYFVILGRGEKENEFKKLALELKVNDRVHFLGAFDQSELINYTAAADIGLALIENISISYYYALPNKLFEYIMAGLPVICSALPQMKEIVERYKVGVITNIEDENRIVDSVNLIGSDKDALAKYKVNCERAAIELNWETEYNKVKDLLIG
ncbi:glycosyltransferase [Bacteroidota bacterium]